MRYGIVGTAALAAAFALSAALAVAADAKPAEPAPKAKAAEKSAKAKRGEPSADRPVDINRANKAQLMRLPGVDEATAAKIIEGRPYRSKAELVTRKVVPAGVYEGIKRAVVAKPK